jgi:hypothetical protein
VGISGLITPLLVEEYLYSDPRLTYLRFIYLRRQEDYVE